MKYSIALLQFPVKILITHEVQKPPPIAASLLFLSYYLSPSSVHGGITVVFHVSLGYCVTLLG